MGLGTETLSGMKGISSVGKKMHTNIGTVGVLNTVQAIHGVQSRVNQGDSYMSSIAKEGVNWAMFAYAPKLAMATQLAPAVVGGVRGAYRFRRQRHVDYINRKEHSAGNTVGGHYMDTNAAMTMRQAAVQQIQGNKLNARSALGGEARIFANNAGYF